MHPVHQPRHSVFRGLLCVTVLACAPAPFAAPAACTGKYADLQAYAGNHVRDSNLLAAPPVAAHLQRLPATVRDHLTRNLAVAGTIDLVDCHLVLRGNAPHMGGAENALLDVNLYSGAVTSAIHSHGRTDIWLDQDPAADTPGGPYGAVPGAVQDWALLADLGFPHQQPRTVQVHAPPR